MRPQWQFLSTSSGDTPDPRIRLFRQEHMSKLESWLSDYLGKTICLANKNVLVPQSPIADLSLAEVNSLKSRVYDLYAQDLDLLESL